MNLEKTALIVVDLQKGVVENIAGQPYDTATVVENSVKLAQAFRAKNGFVTLVNVGFFDGKDALKPETDQPAQATEMRPKSFSELIPELGPEEGDLLVTKNQWGAFFGTNLDLQLRRRGIDTIVMTGIATNIGVGTTAIEAYQRNYNQIFAIDAMNAITAEEHEYMEKYMFPRMGKIRKTEEILAFL
ncbi:MAG TPA: isochorismatase family protein [Bacillales bacterium]|nr:isochorismatase family protein [Bacillales bacterium]